MVIMSVHGSSLPLCVAHLPIHILGPGSASALSFGFAMSDDPGVQFMGARSTKRTARQMSHESTEGSQPSWHRHFHPPPSPPRGDSQAPHLPLMSGFRDYGAIPRTTRSIAPEGSVIDLTEDPDTPPRPTQPRAPDSGSSNTGRLPRFGRNIMADVVDLAQESDDPAEGPSSSPEVQFVGATVRPPSQRQRQRLPYPRPFNERSHSRASRFQPFPQIPDQNLTPFGTLGWNHPGVGLERFILGEETLDYSFPFMLDYHTVPFDVGPRLSPPQAHSRQRDAYKAPSPPPEGFTRTLQEEDVAVCPNCSWELGTGEGKKQEIWVAKPCGHVYCGECTENRSKSKHKKTQGSPKTKTFHKCQVPDCGKTVSSPTAMFHLYL